MPSSTGDSTTDTDDENDDHDARPPSPGRLYVLAHPHHVHAVQLTADADWSAAAQWCNGHLIERGDARMVVFRDHRCQEVSALLGDWIVESDTGYFVLPDQTFTIHYGTGGLELDARRLTELGQVVHKLMDAHSRAEEPLRPVRTWVQLTDSERALAIVVAETLYRLGAVTTRIQNAGGAA